MEEIPLYFFIAIGHNCEFHWIWKPFSRRFDGPFIVEIYYFCHGATSALF